MRLLNSVQILLLMNESILFSSYLQFCFSVRNGVIHLLFVYYFWLHISGFNNWQNFSVSTFRNVSGEDLSCSQVMDDEIDNINPLDPACDLGVGVEEECIEEDDSDEDYSSIQRPAFFVTGEPNFDAGPPQDGLEYLRRVRYYFLLKSLFSSSP